MFAIPSAGTGETDSILRSLYSTADDPIPDLMYFKVICLEPLCGTACALDFQRTNLMLEVMLMTPLRPHGSDSLLMPF